MNLDQYIPTNPQEYITCVRQLGVIISKAMDEFQKEAQNYTQDRHRQDVLKRFADGVETIACLRGDSGLFQTTRPEGLMEFQNEMYDIEYALRDRLLSLGYTYPRR